MNIREDHFPAKSVRRKAPPRSHGRDILRRHQLQQPGHHLHGAVSESRHDENKKRLLEVLTTIIVDPNVGGGGTLDATADRITSIISSDISITIAEIIEITPTSLSPAPESALLETNAFLSPPIATNPAETAPASDLLTSNTDESATPLPTETTSTGSPSDASTTELWISTSVPDIVTEISPLTTLVSSFTLSSNVTESLELLTSTSVFNTPTTLLLGLTGSRSIPVPSVSINVSSLLSQVPTLTLPSAGPTIINGSTLPLSSISVPTPSTLLFSASTLSTPFHNSTVVSTVTSIHKTSSAPANTTTESTSATSSTTIVTSLPANLTSSFPSTTRTSSFLNSTSSKISSSASSSFSGSSSSVSASFSGSSFRSASASATSSFTFAPPGSSPTTIGGPASSSTAPATTNPTIVPLVPAIVGSVGGVLLLAALGVLLFAYRRRRITRLSSGPGEFSAGPQFKTERGFTVLSGQRLDTGISGGTPVVYREAGPTAGPSEVSRTASASRFTEHL